MLNLRVHPLLVGTGARLFDETTPPCPQRPASAQAFGSGVIHLVYRPAAD